MRPKTKNANKPKQAQSKPEIASDASLTPILDPAALLEAAKKEPRVIAARDYIETINILRHQKSFSFREIADWLNAHGVPLDNNDVYRAYMADMSDDEKMAMQHYRKQPDPED